MNQCVSHRGACLCGQAEVDRLRDGIREVVGWGTMFDAKGTHSRRVVAHLTQLLDEEGDGA